MMLGFYKFLIWFFTIVSLIALIYGILEANLTYIGLFIASLIISVVFYRLDEISEKEIKSQNDIKDFSLKGIDDQNEEILTATENLKLEQTKLLADLKAKIYFNKEFSDLKRIKIEIIKNFINGLKINFESITKQELQDLLIGLFNDLERKNMNFLFDPNFFPSDVNGYIDWTKRSLILLGWTIRKEDFALEHFFSCLFERSGLVIGVTITTELGVDNLSLKQHEHFISTGAIDFSVFVTPFVTKDLREFFSSKRKILIIEHKDLITLSSKLREII